MQNVRCDVCGHSMDMMDYRLVPRDELVYRARNGDYMSLDIGWHWCPECNFWEHQPSIEMLKVMASR